MTLRQTALGLAVASGLLVGMSACGGDDKTATASDLPTSVPTDASASATPTPVDPTAAAKVKVLKDYQEFLDVRARGLLSNSPGYPYEQVMTGNALQTAKSYVGGMALINAKFSGSYKYLQGSVVALNLKGKPATATVRACAMDSIILTSKAGKAQNEAAKVSTDDDLVLTGGKWKVTETATLDDTGEGCKA